MSSIIGHMLGGAVAAKTAAGEISTQQRRRFYVLAALVSVLPDLDVVVFMLLRPLEMTPHRGASHSLLFAALSALLLTLLCARFFSMTRVRLFACILAAYCSHLVLDYLMGSGPEVPFFWPFSVQGYLSPLQLVPTAYYGLSVDALMAVMLAPATYAGIALELAIFVPLLCLPTVQTWPQRVPLLLASVAGVVATVVLYNGLR